MSTSSRLNKMQRTEEWKRRVEENLKSVNKICRTLQCSWVCTEVRPWQFRSGVSLLLQCYYNKAANRCTHCIRCPYFSLSTCPPNCSCTILSMIIYNCYGSWKVFSCLLRWPITISAGLSRCSIFGEHVCSHLLRLFSYWNKAGGPFFRSWVIKSLFLLGQCYPHKGLYNLSHTQSWFRCHLHVVHRGHYSLCPQCTVSDKLDAENKSNILLSLMLQLTNY